MAWVRAFKTGSKAYPIREGKLKMMKNKRLEGRRKKISKEIDLFVKQSFDIVDRIHEILAKQGKEQKDLATALDKSESEISKWMTGTHNFTNELPRRRAAGYR